MPKWRFVYDTPPKSTVKQKIHCFTCKRDVRNHSEAGKYHKGHECEYVPDPVKN